MHRSRYALSQAVCYAPVLVGLDAVVGPGLDFSAVSALEISTELCGSASISIPSKIDRV